jgi:hypothetical protein
MKWFIVGLLSLSASGASALQVMDDSALVIGQELLAQIDRSAGEKVRDPTSILYRDLSLGKLLDGRYQNVCGYLNAKNAFGAYVGFTPFWFGGNGISIFEKNDMPVMNQIQAISFEGVGCGKYLPRALFFK